jgi:hypothetical protein
MYAEQAGLSCATLKHMPSNQERQEAASDLWQDIALFKVLS